MLGNEAVYVDKIQKLEAELSVYKRAYNDVDAERRQFEKLRQEAQKEKEDLENQIKVERILTFPVQDLLNITLTGLSCCYSPRRRRRYFLHRFGSAR